MNAAQSALQKTLVTHGIKKTHTDSDFERGRSGCGGIVAGMVVLQRERQCAASGSAVSRSIHGRQASDRFRSAGYCRIRI